MASARNGNPPCSRPGRLPCSGRRQCRAANAPHNAIAQALRASAAACGRRAHHPFRHAGLRAHRAAAHPLCRSVLLVSHDRQLLDAVCTHIVELEDGRLTVVFASNYSDYLAHKSPPSGTAKRRPMPSTTRNRPCAARRWPPRNVPERCAKRAFRMGLSEARLHRKRPADRRGCSPATAQGAANPPGTPACPGAAAGPAGHPHVRPPPHCHQTALSPRAWTSLPEPNGCLTDAHFTLPAGSAYRPGGTQRGG